MNQRSCEISVVAPVFDEEAVVEEFYQRVSQILKSREMSYEIIFVDDGSLDRSFPLLCQIRQNDPGHVKVIRFARNFGHQLAITAGIRHARGSAVVVMDSDLQDPPEVTLQFIAKWKEGYDVVYGVRTKRKGETWFKKITARMFYKLMCWAARIDIPENVGDFYLLDRKIIDILNGMEERHRFMRGLVAWVGYKRVGVEYVREARYAGNSKYGLWKMIQFSFDAATSFSFLPLRIISLIGAVISFMAFVGILLTIYARLFTNATITGWSSLMVVVLFIGGIQLLATGVIGEYVARIGDDVKKRPLYTIEQILE